MTRLFFLLCLLGFNLVRFASAQVEPSLSSRQEFVRARFLATNICSQCHLFPEPETLDRRTWREKVKPLMRLRMGVSALENDLSPNARILMQEWNAIWEDFIFVAAPEQALPQDPRPPIVPDLTLFDVEDPHYQPQNGYATLVQIDSQAHQIYVGNAMTKTLDVLNATGHPLSSSPVDSSIAHLVKGPEGWVGTQIGMIVPSDQPLGRVTLYDKKENRFEKVHDLVTGLIRPVHTTFAELVTRGCENLVVSCFGSINGRSSWFTKQVSGSYTEEILFERPGALLSRVIDVNRDGKPDLVFLTAQGKEGIFLYLNKGRGEFVEKVLIQQPPVWGYVYFEFADFNGDGHPEILTANGDLGDFETPPKKYHGIRIYLNDGNWNFKEAYFYPLNGAFKCVARDFDGDGDLDIAAISFFPDYNKSPEESFVYLENRGGLTFKAHTFAENFRGRWITMDVGDLDGDGDLDIVLGGGYKVPLRVPKSFFDRWQREAPSILILRNQLSGRKEKSAAK